MSIPVTVQVPLPTAWRGFGFGAMWDADDHTWIVSHDGGFVMVAEIAEGVWAKVVYLGHEPPYLLIRTGSAEAVAAELVADYHCYEVLYDGGLDLAGIEQENDGDNNGD